MPFEAVVEPPRRPEPQRGVVAGQRRQLPRVGRLVEREHDQREARVVAEPLEQRPQVPRELRRDRDVGAHVGPEPLEERAVVVAERADVELHHQPVLDAHAGHLDEHVAANRRASAGGRRPRSAAANIASLRSRRGGAV